jgi:hypothetical protein
MMPVAIAGKEAKMAMGGALVRVKRRLLFLYVYAQYKDDETVRWLRRSTEEWVDAVLEANR